MAYQVVGQFGDGELSYEQAMTAIFIEVGAPPTGVDGLCTSLHAVHVAARTGAAGLCTLLTQHAALACTPVGVRVHESGLQAWQPPACWRDSTLDPPSGATGVADRTLPCLVLTQGWIFMLLSVTGVRGGIVKYMPKSIAMASSGVQAGPRGRLLLRPAEPPVPAAAVVPAIRAIAWQCTPAAPHNGSGFP